MSLKEVAEELRNSNNFLITAHTNPEGDALGSELAFYRLLKSMGKKAIILNDDRLPYGLDFLPGAALIRRLDKNSQGLKFDVFVALDCSDLRRTGGVGNLCGRNTKIINIDHHISNAGFGTVNWVDAGASSCAEMIYRLYSFMRLPLDKEAATCIYVGILTDTGSFRYSNTTTRTHRVVSELLKYKLGIPQIYKSVYENIPFADMELLAGILPTMQRRMQGRLVWFKITKELLKKHEGLSFDLSEHVLSFARAIKDVEVAVLFKENLKAKDEVRVNFRSQGNVDVNKVAACFGGGGHKTASGCTIKGKIQDVERMVLSKVKSAFV